MAAGFMLATALAVSAKWRQPPARRPPSSLSYLRELPIDILKIDIAFVAALDSGREAPAVMRSIIRLAGTLGLRTIAEGIERPEQSRQLQSLGADLGQGFHYAVPLTESELRDYFGAWRRSTSENVALA